MTCRPGHTTGHDSPSQAATSPEPAAWLERQVDALPNQMNRALTGAEAVLLIQAGGYQRAFGLLGGDHFRKRRGNGCYHLRVVGPRAFLHWDRWDPRRFPVEHFFETPALWRTAAAIGIAVFLGASASSKRRHR